MTEPYIPYCGPAPAPVGLASAWNADPFLLVAAAALLAFLAAVSDRPMRRGLRSAPVAAAFMLAIVAFVSPLCALTTALFSARIAHHVILVAFIAPMLALAFPARRAGPILPAWLLFAAHTGLMWLWHAPAPYAAALSSHAVYWTMEASLLVSAVLLWQSALSHAAPAGRALGILLGQVVQMGMLGALFTFAGRPLFSPHFLTTGPFGLSPLADQQLAGLIMWVPAALPYLCAALFIMARLLRPEAAHGGKSPA